jgi:hypothetical protein
MSSPAGPRPLRLRLRDVAAQALVRPVLVVFWSLVIWGTLLGLAFLYAAFTRGPSAAVEALLPATGGIRVWFNLALAVLAALAWIAVATAVRRGRREG